MKPFLCLLLLFVSSFVFANDIETLQKIHNAQIGYAIHDAETGRSSSFNGQAQFPLMSTFKTFACAKLLYEAQKNPALLTHEAMIEKAKIIPWSPVTEKQIGKQITLQDACKATMLTSDNTAANLVLENIGGPQAVTAFFRQLGDQSSRLDRYEPALNQAQKGDNRDTTSPLAMNKNLQSIHSGLHLTETGKNTLLSWMMNNEVSNPLIRSFLPKNWKIADRSGAGENGSRGITAIIWKENRMPVYLTIYMTQSKLDMNRRNEILNQTANIALKEIGLFF